jgi:hypothetical protein
MGSLNFFSIVESVDVLDHLGVVCINGFNFQSGDCDAIVLEYGVVFIDEGLLTFFSVEDAARNILSVLGDESIELNPFKRRADDVVSQLTGGDEGQNQTTDRSQHLESIKYSMLPRCLPGDLRHSFVEVVGILVVAAQRWLTSNEVLIIDNVRQTDDH